MKCIIDIIKKSNTSRFWLIVCFFMAIFSSLLSIIPIQFIGFSISALSDQKDKEFIWSILKSYLTYLGTDNISIAISGLILFFLFTLVAIIFRNLFCYIATVVSDNIIFNLRKVIFKKITLLKFDECKKISNGRIIYITMNDTNNLDQIFSNPLYTLFSDAFDLLWISIFLFYLDPILILILISITPFLYLASLRTAKTQKKLQEKIQESDTNLTTILEQALIGFEMIKSLGGESYENNTFSKKALDSFKDRKKSALIMSLFFPIEGVLRAIGTFLVFIYGIYEFKHGNISIGVLPILYQYTSKFYSPIRNLARYYQTIQMGLVSANRINNYLDTMEEEVYNKKAIDFPISLEKISIKNLSFNIENTNIIKNLSFDCKKGDFILIKGKSGCGKTTFIRLILGLLEKKEGDIVFNESNIEAIKKESLRKNISYVSQETFLHNDTIINNITYPKNNIGDNSLIESMLNNFNLKDKTLDYMVGENGNNLSIGQKRRIDLIRALLRKSQIIILDEVTAGLDIENENLILDALKSFKQKRIIFFISHNENKKVYELSNKTLLFK